MCKDCLPEKSIGDNIKRDVTEELQEECTFESQGLAWFFALSMYVLINLSDAEFYPAFQTYFEATFLDPGCSTDKILMRLKIFVMGF